MPYNTNDLVRSLLGIDGLHMAGDDCKETHQHRIMAMIFVAGGCDEEVM